MLHAVHKNFLVQKIFKLNLLQNRTVNEKMI